MLFTTDKQTLDDLNIFGKHGGDSIFNIFNRCTTRGGAAIMEDLFRYPLSNHNDINKRSNLISFLAACNTKFPFNSTLFDAAEACLANTDERTRLSAQENSIGKKIGNFVAADVETQQITKGILALATLLKETECFVEAPEPNGIPAPELYNEWKQGVTAILGLTELKVITGNKAKPGVAQIASWDTILRFSHRDNIEKLLRQLYHMDVWFAVADVAKERGFSFPKALPAAKQSVILQGFYHPHVTNAVSNDFVVTPDGNLVFLTGANMAGKSTFMKSVTVALFLAHMGFPVPAASMEFAVFDGIYTTINLPDNLGIGASHFYAEVLRVKKVVAELKQSKRLFIVFDELFRGTNVKDAYEATIAIAQGFAARRNSAFVISTHIIEAGEVLKDKCASVVFRYLPTLMNNNQPIYTYKLENGISADRHGMVIIQNEGILDMLANGKKKNFKTKQEHELHNR